MIRLTTIALALVAVACGGSSNEAAEPTPAPAPAAETAPAADTAPAAETAPNPDTTAETAPAAEQPSADADIDAAWKLMQDLAAAAQVDGTCKVKADAMSKVVDANEELIARASKMNDNAEMKEKWDAKYGQQAMELMTEMATVSLKDCMADPDVGAVMKRLAGE